MNYAYDPRRFDPEIVRQLGRIDLIAEVIASGARAGLHRSRRRGFSTEFSDFKPYAAGDDIRLLDERIYARTDKLFVRRFEAETSTEAMLLLDASRSMAWRWEEAVSKLEYGANLLAALACLHIRQHDQVGLLLHDATTLHHLPPRCRRAQLEAIYAMLEGCRPGAADTFAGLVRGLTQLRRHRGMVFLCSDLEEDEEHVNRAFAELSGMGDDVICFHILDAAEESLPFETATHLRDSETDAIIPVNVGRFRDTYQASVRTFREHWERQCRDAGIIYVPVHTGRSYVEVVQDMVAIRNRAHA